MNSPLQFDTTTLIWLHQFATPILDRLATLLTSLGGPGVILVITLLVALVLYRRHPRAMTMLLLSVGGAAIINVVLKTAIHRVRPALWAQVVTEKSFSFPSGHAMASSALAFSLIFIAWHTRWRWYALILGLLYVVIIGLTRLYLGVHFPTDVIGGWIVSFAWVALVRTVLLRVHLNPKPTATLPAP